jgi:acetylornithine deacetylase
LSYSTEILFQDSVELLTKLISIPSLSFEEETASIFLFEYLLSRKAEPRRIGNNIVALNKFYVPDKQTILLNSHVDTVKPNSGYTRDPFQPEIIDGKIYGLGSNDAGGALVTMLNTFLYFYEMEDLNYNLAFIASTEEETGTEGGLANTLSKIDFKIDFAFIGEPTNMNMAIAEKGLLVLDCTSHGISGHAARDEGINAIYSALEDIDWFRNYSFEKVSELLGHVKMTVTTINAGYQHNIVPDRCTYCVDIRLNELYTHQEIIEVISKNVKAEIKPRSLKYKPSFTPIDNYFVKVGMELGLKTFGSPTCSDRIHMNFPALKMGPGDSSRSHTADEFIFLDEIRNGLEIYIKFLNKVFREK